MSAPHHRADQTTGALLADVLAGLTRLVRGEIALARAETAEKLRGVAFALAQFVMAAILGVAAVTMLAGAGAAALVAFGLSVWAAALITGVVLLLLAYACLRWGVYLLSPRHLTPSRSLSNLSRDAAAFKSMVKPDDES